MPRRRCSNSVAPARLASRRVLGLVVLGLSAVCGACGGCTVSVGKVHADFPKLQPSRIAVPRPVDATYLRLDQIGFAGPLERVFGGGQVHDVPAELQQGLREALHLKGYQTESRIPPGKDFRQPLPEGEEVPGFQAVLYATIESWRSKSRPPFEVEMSYRLALYHVPTGTLLYENTCPLRAGGKGHTSPRFLRNALRKSARRGISTLPAGG